MKVYRHICDGSAGLSVDTTRFLVANDETEIIHLYRNDNQTAEPIDAFDFTDLLRDDPDNECDLEGSAEIGETVYWIGSHGRNRKGKLRPNRHRLFATRLAAKKSTVKLTWDGRYDDLARDLCDLNNWESASEAGTRSVVEALIAATRLSERKVKKLAPKKFGLNIEGLAARPDGSALLIGLRNPIPDAKALLIPLNNPAALISNGATQARFGRPIEFDLDGLGIRSIGYVPALTAYVIIAGPSKSGGPYRLYRWSGADDDPAVFDRDLEETNEFAPEAIVTYGDSHRIQLLGDGGNVISAGLKCKDRPVEQKYFTDRWHYAI